MVKSRYRYLVLKKGRGERAETRLLSIRDELKEAGLPCNFYELQFDDQISLYAKIKFDLSAKQCKIVEKYLLTKTENEDYYKLELESLYQKNLLNRALVYVGFNPIH